MRILRIGTAGTKIGQHVHAALVSWRRGEQVRGGIALVGATPTGCKQPVDAIILLPRGVLVVVGVDLPDPAKRLEAPVDGPWVADGWPLVNETEPRAVNPARQALRTASAAVRALREPLGEPLTTCVILAAGPYAGEVVAPPSDLARGVRVLFPEPANLRTAADQLHGEVFTFDQVRAALRELAPAYAGMPDTALREEGFAERPEQRSGGGRGGQPPVPAPPSGTPAAPVRTAAPWWRRRPSWLPFAAGAVVLLGVAGLGLLTAGLGADTTAAAASGAAAEPTGAPVTAGASTYRRAAVSRDGQNGHYAVHAYGDVRTALHRLPCTGLTRAVYACAAGGRGAAVALATVRFTEPGAAERFHQAATTPGSGGITDLLTEGTRWRGAPRSFDNAVYRSSLEGATVRLAAAVYADARPAPEDPGLTRLAEDALRLPA